MSTKLKLPPMRPAGDPDEYSEEQIVAEYHKVVRRGDVRALLYFIINYVKIYSNDDQGWIPFVLWDTDTGEYDNQLTLAQKVMNEQYLAILKARQVGITWEILAYILWMVLFFPTQNVLLLSKGDEESQQLIKRLKDMYARLPYWMRAKDVITDNLHELRLSNGSFVKSVSTRGGDSMTFTIAVVDEADLVWRSNTSLAQVLLNISPTVGLKGKLILLSKSEKARPNSTFKNLYRGAIEGTNQYTGVFIPWYVNPERNPTWYEQQKQVSLDIDNTLDNLWESYPANPEEALAPKSASKRLPFAWLRNSYVKIQPKYIIKKTIETDLDGYDGPVIDGLVVYKTPHPDKKYVLGADPAEGLPTSDDSAIVVMDIETQEEVATYAEKTDPESFAVVIDQIGTYYNKAKVLYELNNHGGLLGKSLREVSNLTRLKGWMPTKGKVQQREGWYNANKAIKTMLYDTVAQQFRNNMCELHSPKTHSQLSSIDQNTLKAPPGENDDLATAFALCIAAINLCITSFSWDTIKIR